MLVFLVLWFVELIRFANGNAEKIVLSRQDFQRVPGLGMFEHQIDVNFSTPISTRIPSYYLEHFNLSRKNLLGEGPSRAIFNLKVAPIHVYVDDRWFDYWTRLEIRICWSASVRALKIITGNIFAGSH